MPTGSANLIELESVRAFAHTLNLRTGADWDTWCRIPGNRPPDIPSSPEIVYRTQGWLSYADFLHPPA